MQPEKSVLINQTETFIRDAFFNKNGTMMIAHDFKHIDRVRNWAVLIAEKEKYPYREIVEITALLHDIGRSGISGAMEKEHRDHGLLGAEIAAKFLGEQSKLGPGDVELIVDTVRHHNDPPDLMDEHISSLGNKGKLLGIISDADRIDALGAVGLMRAFTSKYFLPDYDPENIKGGDWGLSTSEFLSKSGVHSGKAIPPVDNIIDQINQQIRYYDSLHTRTARKLAAPLVKYMQEFVLQLESEISGKGSSGQ